MRAFQMPDCFAISFGSGPCRPCPGSTLAVLAGFTAARGAIALRVVADPDRFGALRALIFLRAEVFAVFDVLRAVRAVLAISDISSSCYMSAIGVDRPDLQTILGLL